MMMMMMIIIIIIIIIIIMIIIIRRHLRCQLRTAAGADRALGRPCSHQSVRPAYEAPSPRRASEPGAAHRSRQARAVAPVERHVLKP